MEEPPPTGSNLPELAKELYLAGYDCLREGKFLQGIEALERSLATYQQLVTKGPENYPHERFRYGLTWASVTRQRNAHRKQSGVLVNL